MYHSITIGDKNTWDDWKLVPSSRPVFNPPEPKLNYIEIPGVDGKLDASTVLTGEILYQNRTGSVEFYVMNGYKSWDARYSEISNYVHGIDFKRIILEDDPSHYYTGRVTVNKWESSKDYSRITLDFDLYPYKMDMQSSLDDWLWDPFDFDNGIVRDYRDILVDTVGAFHQGIPQSPTVLEIDGDRKTVIPTFIVNQPYANASLFVEWSGLPGRRFEMSRELAQQYSNKFQFPDIRLKEGISTLTFYGCGYVSVDYRGGSL